MIFPVLVLISLALVINVSDVSAATVNNSTASTQTVAQPTATTQPTTTTQTVASTQPAATTQAATSTQAAGSAQSASSQGATAVSPQVTYTPSQVNDAANRVKSFYDTNNRLPNYVTMNNKQVTMPQFLELLTTDITQSNSGSTASIILKNVNNPSNPSETVKSGTLTKSEYVALAQTVKNSIDSTGTAPNNISSSLGQIRFESLVYIFSKTMSFYATNHRLPNTLSVTPWSSGSTVTSGEGSGTSSTNVQAILDAIGKAEAKFADVQGQSSAATMVKVGYGDCWADAEWLYNQLNAAGIQAEIMGYVGGGSGSWYRHAWVRYNIGNGFVDWAYTKYGSQHHGDGLGAKSYVLIAPSSKTVDVSNMIATGY